MRVPDPAPLESPAPDSAPIPGCDEPPPARLLCGIEQFNRGEYWECHETLEALWIAEPREVRNLYQGILQVGVALHHLRNRNLPGALKVFRRGLRRLRSLPATCQGVDVAQLVADAAAVQDAALDAGLAGAGGPDAAFPQIRLVAGAGPEGERP